MLNSLVNVRLYIKLLKIGSATFHILRHFEVDIISEYNVYSNFKKKSIIQIEGICRKLEFNQVSF